MKEPPKISLRMKIFLLNLTVVISGLLLFSVILIGITLNKEIMQKKESSRWALNQTGILISNHSVLLRNQIDKITLDDRVIDILERDKSMQYHSWDAWNEDRIFLDGLINSVIYLSELQEIKIVTDHAISSAYSSTHIMSPKDLEKTRWYKRSLDIYDTYFWNQLSDINIEDDDEHIMFTRNLKYSYPTYNTHFIGIIKKDLFQTILSANATDRFTSNFIINAEDTVLLSSDVESDFPYSEVISLVRQHEEKTDAPMDISMFKINSTNYNIGAYRIAQTDMTLVFAFSSTDMIRSVLLENARLIFIIILITFLFVMVFSFFISYSITKPIAMLIQRMNKVSGGDFSLDIMPPGSDHEVNLLIKNFNYMTTRMAILMDESFEYGKKAKQMEFLALQAQINPHFLYNTLDLIRWKAVKDNNQEIQALVTSLSTYYRNSLSKGKSFVTLKSEIEHNSSYVNIQNMRFDQELSLRVLVPDECLSIALPKLILQPLVENAIEHGILESENDSGSILIRSWIEDKTLVLVVADDGIGMPTSDAEKLPTMPSDEQILKSGYGLWNVAERLKVVYNNRAKIDFISSLGHGMAVVMQVPCTLEENKEED